LIKKFFRDTRAMAAVEASILLPIMLMIFCGLALASMYLPIRVALQRATQIAATAIANENSDTWVIYNAANMEYEWGNRADLRNVYVSLFRNPDVSKAEAIVRQAEERGISFRPGTLTVNARVSNHILYKEVAVTATRSIRMRDEGVNLSTVRFPGRIDITVTSTALVHNAEDFVRNVDLAVNFVGNFVKVEDSLGKLISRFGGSVFGW
jgi:hypothetical protein